MIAILLHLYYEASWETIIREKLIKIKNLRIQLLVNICNVIQNKELLIKKIKVDFPDSYIIETPNKGKDIGGKLALMDLLLQVNLSCEYIILLHDKLSPQSITGETWRETLMKIVDPPVADKIIGMYEKDKLLGIVAAREFIIEDSDIRNSNKNNEQLIIDLSKRYLLKLATHPFIGGSMFWVRASIFRKFFIQFPPLFCREVLEYGNVLDIENGSYTHSWERLFCRIAVSDNFMIKGI